MTRHRIRVAAPAFALLVFASSAPAQAPPARVKAAIDSTFAQTVAAANRADVDATFRAFAPDAVNLNNGRVYPNRDAFVAAFRPVFARLRSQDIRVEQSSYKMLSPTFVLSTHNGTFTSTDTTGAVSPWRPFAWTLVWHLENRAWKMTSTHQSFGAPAQTAMVSQAGDNHTAEAAIRSQIDSYVRSVLARDYYAFGNLLTPDFVAYPPNHAPLVGREASVEFLKAFPKLTNFTVTTDEVSVRGDIGYARGAYALTGTLPDGNVINDKGSFLEIHRRQSDGTWPHTVLIWQSDSPPPASK